MDMSKNLTLQKGEENVSCHPLATLLQSPKCFCLRLWNLDTNGSWRLDGLETFDSFESSWLDSLEKFDSFDSSWLEGLEKFDTLDSSRLESLEKFDSFDSSWLGGLEKFDTLDSSWLEGLEKFDTFDSSRPEWLERSGHEVRDMWSRKKLFETMTRASLTHPLFFWSFWQI